MKTAQPSVSILEHFADLKDPRRETANKFHKLLDIVVIAVCGVISGCDGGGEQLAAFGRENEAWLRKFLELPHGIPSHDTFSRVLRLINPEKFQTCFTSWVLSLHEATSGQVIPIDGKTLRGSFDTASGQKPLHLVSAWCAAHRVTLGQVAVDEKSNEITAIPKLLEILDVTGAIITIDAMGCQKEIARQIRQQGGDYVLAVKNNQPHLHEDIQAFYFEHLENEFADVEHDFYETREKGHGREEFRYYHTFPVPETIRNQEQWKDLRTIGVVLSDCGREGKFVCETRFFISSLESNAQQFAHAVRSHWGIENSLHWVLDVTFKEDQSRIRKGHGAEIFAALRRMGLALLRTDSSPGSIPVKRLKCAWNRNYRWQVLTGMPAK